jgi:phosphoglycolate phosphatase-like HAD superfamily hydrolase
MLLPGPNVIALDFDGVLCDSARETGITAWRAGQRFFPEWHSTNPPADVLSRFCRLRPALETGFQAIPLMRLAFENHPPDDVFCRFPELVNHLTAQMHTTREELLREFAQTRDEWIAKDRPGWLAQHSFFPGIANALKSALKKHHVFILTTKQTRFAETLLRAIDIRLPKGHILGLESGVSKERLLTFILDNPACRKLPVHFVEDRLATLEGVAASPALTSVRLYLADWGYVTPADVQQAQLSGRIMVLSLSAFLQ